MHGVPVLTMLLDIADKQHRTDNNSQGLHLGLADQTTYQAGLVDAWTTIKQRLCHDCDLMTCQFGPSTSKTYKEVKYVATILVLG